VGTRSAGKLFVLSHASPTARLTAIRLFQRAGKDLGRQNEMVRDFHGIRIKGLNVIGLFEADQNLQGGEGERLCCVNDWTAGAVPAG